MLLPMSAVRAGTAWAILLGAAAHWGKASLQAQTFPAEFTSVGSVRELSDGRTLVTDPRERRLLVLDWGAGRVRDIGRVGDGPGEFRALTQLVALPADTTIVVDGVSRRWILYVADRYRSSVAPEQVLHLSQFFSPVLGADMRGGVLVAGAVTWEGERERAALSRLPAYAESLSVLRLERGSTRIDTIAGLRGRPWGVSNILYGSGAQRMTYVANNPLTAPEQALMFPDGAVAIARQQPFRVEWIAPGGRRLVGPVLDSAPVRATQRERMAAIARAWPNPNDPPLAESDVAGWPELVPAFPADALLAVPGNRLALRRHITTVAPHERVDVIDSDGRLIKRVQLQAGEKAVAFGARYLYVVRTDEDGFVRLSRRDW